MSRSTLLVLTTTATLLLPGAASAQAKRYPLEAVEGLRFHNVTAEPAMLQALPFSTGAIRRATAMAMV
jgi:hypothetical protein